MVRPKLTQQRNHVARRTKKETRPSSRSAKPTRLREGHVADPSSYDWLPDEESFWESAKRATPEQVAKAQFVKGVGRLLEEVGRSRKWSIVPEPPEPLLFEDEKAFRLRYETWLATPTTTRECRARWHAAQAEYALRELSLLQEDRNLDSWRCLDLACMGLAGLLVRDKGYELLGEMISQPKRLHVGSSKAARVFARDVFAALKRDRYGGDSPGYVRLALDLVEDVREPDVHPEQRASWLLHFLSRNSVPGAWAEVDREELSSRLNNVRKSNSAIVKFLAASATGAFDIGKRSNIVELVRKALARK